MIALFILIVAMLNFILGFYVFLNNPKKPINVSFGLSTFLIGLWVFLNYFFLKYASINVLRAIYALAPFIIISIAWWILILKNKITDKKYLNLNIVLIGISSIFAMLMFISPKMIEYVNGPFDYKTGTYFDIFTAYILILFLGFAIYFIFQYKKADRIFKDQIKLIFIGIITTVLIAAVVGFILPSFGVTKFNFLDSPSSIFFILLSFYSIIKYKFLNIKVIGIEVFATFLAFLSFVGLLNSIDLSDFILNLILFLITLFFAGLLIRSVFTEKKRMELVEDLNKKLNKSALDLKKKALHLSKLLKMRTEFLDTASHQLKTPISVIRGTLSMFEEGSMDKLPKEQQMKFFHSMSMKADKLNAIISDILRASELDTDEFKIDYATAKPENVEEMVKSIIEQLQPQIDEKKLEVKLEVEKNIPLIMTSGEFLEQAIYNLVDNAIKYTPQGYVKIFLLKDNNNLIIKVQDNGIGIPEIELKKIFDKFARGSNAVDVYANGTGLGLFIVKRIVEAHQGGKVSVESKEGKGTTFTISLPFDFKNVKKVLLKNKNGEKNKTKIKAKATV